MAALQPGDYMAKVDINPFTACMTYMYVIKTLLVFAYMTYMYVIHVSKAVADVLDPMYGI